MHADIPPEIQIKRLERRHQCLDGIVGGPKYTFFFDTAMTPPKSFHPVEVARTGHGVRETRLNVGLEAPGCAKIRRLKPDTTISHYRIRASLGAGGMGEVFLAEDTKLQRKVAIKVLLPGLASDGTAGKRLLREARAAAALDHPNICAIHEVAEDDGRTFIVMQYIEGETLQARMRRGAPPFLEALPIARQVVDALSEAHAHDTIHRDIKPANIMISARGLVKVMDFGLATSGHAGQRERGDGDRPHVARRACSGPSRTCRPSRCGANPSTRAPICSARASCCTSSSRAISRLRRRARPARCRRF